MLTNIEMNMSIKYIYTRFPTNEPSSIIIPFKNPGKYFKPCLESIKNQSYQHFEVLMIDDHSNKEDVEVAKMARDER